MGQMGQLGQRREYMSEISGLQVPQLGWVARLEMGQMGRGVVLDFAHLPGTGAGRFA